MQKFVSENFLMVSFIILIRSVWKQFLKHHHDEFKEQFTFSTN